MISVAYCMFLFFGGGAVWDDIQTQHLSGKQNSEFPDHTICHRQKLHSHSLLPSVANLFCLTFAFGAFPISRNVETTSDFRMENWVLFLSSTFSDIAIDYYNKKTSNRFMCI